MLIPRGYERKGWTQGPSDERNKIWVVEQPKPGYTLLLKSLKKIFRVLVTNLVSLMRAYLKHLFMMWGISGIIEVRKPKDLDSNLTYGY